jgi:hypothetical protein
MKSEQAVLPNPCLEEEEEEEEEEEVTQNSSQIAIASCPMLSYKQDTTICELQFGTSALQLQYEVTLRCKQSHG